MDKINISNNIYIGKNDINKQGQIDSIMKKKEEYKLIPKEVSRQITKEDCQVLNFLKRKHEKESRKYSNLYNSDDLSSKSKRTDKSSKSNGSLE